MKSCQDLTTCLCDTLEDLVDIYQQDYDSQCCGDEEHYPQPNPVMGRKCCPEINQACQKKWKKQQLKWEIRHNKGGLLDWWDRVTLQHETLEPGYGRRPRCGDKVTITYVTKGLDGMSLDWSRRPYTFRVGDPNVMKGLNKGILKCHLGERARLYIPSGLAYGWEGVEGMIKPFTDVILSVDFQKIYGKMGMGMGMGMGCGL